MWWRTSVSRRKFSDTTILKAAISTRVKQGIPIGLLGYAEGETRGLVFHRATTQLPSAGA